MPIDTRAQPTINVRLLPLRWHPAHPPTYAPANRTHAHHAPGPLQILYPQPRMSMVTASLGQIFGLEEDLDCLDSRTYDGEPRCAPRQLCSPALHAPLQAWSWQRLDARSVPVIGAFDIYALLACSMTRLPQPAAPHAWPAVHSAIPPRFILQAVGFSTSHKQIHATHIHTRNIHTHPRLLMQPTMIGARCR